MAGKYDMVYIIQHQQINRDSIKPPYVVIVTIPTDIMVSLRSFLLCYCIFTSTETLIFLPQRILRQCFSLHWSHKDTIQLCALTLVLSMLLNACFPLICECFRYKTIRMTSLNTLSFWIGCS
jgi:hypothetical protein